MKELTIDATVDHIAAVTEFVNAQLEEYDCPMKAQMQIDLAVEEIFVNIANYAYEGKLGSATINIKADAHKATVSFADSGFPYDPLKKEDPNIEQAAEDRPIGGLGIFLVKEMCDEVHYERRGDMNILTIVKKY